MSQFISTAIESVTLKGLECWLKHKYECFGWIVLDLVKGKPEKAYSFIKSLERLKKAIVEHKAIPTTCGHIIRDLEILNYKLEKLQIFSNTLHINSDIINDICIENNINSSTVKEIQQKINEESNSKVEQIEKYETFNKENMESVTLKGLECWLKHKYEHLGWTALAVEKGYVDKGYSYYKSLVRLKEAIQQRQIIQSDCMHTKRDLEVLLFKLHILIKIANLLGINEGLFNRFCLENNIINDSKEYVTLEGLQCWLKNEYELLGWIILCNSKQHYEKVYSYMSSLKKLKKAIDERTEITTECNHIKRDLEVLQYQITELLKTTTNLGFDMIELKKKICNTTGGGLKKNINMKISKSAVKKLLNSINL